MAKLLAIDLGTTYFKFALFNRAGRLRDTRRLALPLSETGPDRMEMSAEAFAEAVGRGIEQLQASNDLSEVEAVSFATQTNSFVLLGENDRPLGPIILWPDRRAASLEAELQRRCDVPDFSATTGIPQLNHQFMAAKLLWLQRHAPETWRQTEKLCLISDYLTLLLTGRHVTEAGAAGLTGLIDIHQCRWWPEILDRLAIDRRLLPEAVRAGTDLGPIAPEPARRYGLPESCRFVVGCLDQYAGAIGAGNVEPGMISETTGTVLATVRCAERFSTRLGPAVFQGPAFRRGLYWRMAFGDVSANYLQRYRDRLPDRPDFDSLTAAAAGIAPGADGLRLRTDAPPTDPEQVFEGLAPRHTRAEQVRCILEAVALALEDQVRSLCDDRLPQQIRCAGGAARSDLWLQIKADVLGVATAATQCEEPTSLGAAMLAEASLAAADLTEVARRWVQLKPPHVPDPQRHGRYRTLYR